MKPFILCVSLVLTTQTAMAAIPMTRFVRVTDSRTIVVAHLNGPEQTVHLSNVEIPAQDEIAARAFLQENLAGRFVYVEDGKVYRSPDALFLNRELAYGAYKTPGLKMMYLGELNPGPRPQAEPHVPPARAPVAGPRPSAASHQTRRRR